MTRGDIHRIKLPSKRGHEQSGARYGVVVQADPLLGLSSSGYEPTRTEQVSRNVLLPLNARQLEAPTDDGTEAGRQLLGAE